MAESRDIRRRVIWPLLVLVVAGAMIMTSRSPTGTMAASDHEIEQWVRSWALAHIDGTSEELPTASTVLDRSLSRRLRALGAAAPWPLVVTVSPGPADSADPAKESRRVRIERGSDAFVVIIVHQLGDGTLVVSGVVVEDSSGGAASEALEAADAADAPAAPTPSKAAP